MAGRLIRYFLCDGDQEVLHGCCLRKTAFLTAFFSITVFLYLLFLPATGHCDLVLVPSALDSRIKTAAVLVYESDRVKVYAPHDMLAANYSICWSNYDEDGKFIMRIFIEYLREEDRLASAKILAAEVASKESIRWGNVGFEHFTTLSQDSMFDLRGGIIVTKNQMSYDKWGYWLTSNDKVIKETLTQNDGLIYLVAKNIDQILQQKLQEEKENPHSCIYMERRKTGAR